MERRNEIIRTNRLINKGLSVLCLLWMYGISSAQQLDLFQSLETGKQNYPYLQSKNAEVNSADRKLNAARTEYVPALTLGHQYTYSTGNNVEGAFFPNEGTALSPSGGIRPDNIYEGAFGSFTSAFLEWKIINFGKVAANVNVARAEHQRSQVEYENELFQYQVRLADAYLLLLSSRYLTEVQLYNVQRAEAYRNSIHALASSGLRSGADSSLAQAEYVKAKLLLLESEKSEKVYRYRFSELLGELKDSIAIDTMDFFNKLPQPTAINRDSFLLSPSLRLYQSYMNASAKRSVAVRRSFYPSVALIGSVWGRGTGISNKTGEYRTDFASGTQYQVYNYLAGVALRWNVSNYFKVRNDYKSEVYQRERYQSLYDHQLLKQSRELKESDAQFDVSLQQATLAPTQRSAAQAAFEQAQARYENGLTDLPTFTQSLLTLNRAEADVCIAYSNAWRALLMKAAASGDLDLFLKQVQ